jgi:arylsulfatase A
MVGKWHLGWDWGKVDAEIDFTQPVENGPTINGFDYYYGHCGSLDMPPYVWVDTGRITAPPDREEGITKEQDRYGWYRQGPIGADFQIADVLPHLFDKSIAYINARVEKQEKFLLYLPLPAPHTPIVPRPQFKDASGLNPYADYVMQVDHHLGQLLDTLDELEITNSTLVIFTSDNGCSPEANFELLKQHGHDPSAGYRGYKADIYEGGHRVPLIVQWPGRISAGRRTDALACLTDVYATLAEITGQSNNSEGGEDSFSWLPLFVGDRTSVRESLVSHSIDGSFAIRRGPWKLCLSAGSGGWSEPTESVAKSKELPQLQLFDLASDKEEKQNVADSHPELVNDLIWLLETQIRNGRCTPGEAKSNDREIEFLPDGVEMPTRSSKSE